MMLVNGIQPEFEDLRPYLLGLAYRVLGSRTDAEDAPMVRATAAAICSTTLAAIGTAVQIELEDERRPAAELFDGALGWR